MTAVLGLAFSAGMVATINPCGFAMLPAYLSYFMGIQGEVKSRTATLRAALVVGGVVSLGFLVVFGAAGVVISGASTRLASDWIPWLALAVGVGLTFLGIAMVGGFEVQVGLPKAGRASQVRSYRNIFGFGVSYAIASLSCTLPVFLSLIATQFSARSFASGLLIFAVYAAGMATVLVALTVVIALGKRSLIGRLRGAGAHINRLSGAILVAAGMWITWFWLTSIRAGASSLNESSSFRFVEALSQEVVNSIADNTLAVAIGLGTLIGVAILVAIRGGNSAAESAVEEEPAVPVEALV